MTPSFFNNTVIRRLTTPMTVMILNNQLISHIPENKPVGTNIANVTITATTNNVMDFVAI